MMRIFFDSLRSRLLFLFLASAILIGLVDYMGSQLIVRRELSNYILHVQHDQIKDWAQLVAALYVGHGSSWQFLRQNGSQSMLFPADGLILGHTQYAILLNGRFYPGYIHPNSSWLSSPIVVKGNQVGTLLVRPSMSSALLNLRDQLSIFFSWIQALCIIAVVALSTVIAVKFLRRVLDPLEQLARAARGISEQIFTVPLPFSKDRQVADVVHAFQTMQRHLKRAQEERERLLADVLHELRTPINIIANQIEAVQIGLYEMTNKQLAVLYDEILRIGSILNDLQQLNDVQTGALQLECIQVDVKELLWSVRELFSVNCATRKIMCDVNVDSDVKWILADPKRMTQVLVNLMSNSMRFTPEGGLINWSAQRDAEKKDNIQITIQDNGPGIETEHLPHLFDRFYRADNSRCRDTGGSGLGLAIVKDIVELHGGSVRVSSDLKKGTTFSISIPVFQFNATHNL